jgi:hypothetical protein
MIFHCAPPRARQVGAAQAFHGYTSMRLRARGRFGAMEQISRINPAAK